MRDETPVPPTFDQRPPPGAEECPQHYFSSPRQATAATDVFTDAANAQNAPKVTATISDNTVGTEERLVYTITIDGSTGRDIVTPQAPSAEGLTLLQASPDTRSSVSIVNGVVSQGYSYSWAYRPDGEGTARLGSTTVQVGNTAYKTNEIAVTVVPQSQRPAPSAQGRARDPFSSLFSQPTIQSDPEPVTIDETDVFIRAIPSKRSVVQNEQVTLTYELFFREEIRPYPMLILRVVYVEEPRDLFLP